MIRQARTTLSACTLAIALAACGDEPRSIRIENVQRSAPGGEYTPRSVSSDFHNPKWRISAPHLRSPFAVYALNDTLGIVLDRTHPFMHLIDVGRGKYLYPLVTSSEDSAEAFNVYRISVSPRDSRDFVGYDVLGGTLTTFRLGNAESPVTATSVVTLKTPEAIDWPVWHPDGRISVELVRDSSLRSFVQPDGSLSAPGGIALSALAPAWVPPGPARDAMEGETCASPDRARLARAFLYSGRLMILDSLGQLEGAKLKAGFFEPQFVVHETGEVVFDTRGNQSRVAYRWCGSTREHIFALYSGSILRPSSRNAFTAASQVHVYDWKGDLKGGFFLQNSAASIDVTPDGRWLLLVEDVREKALAAYEIPRKFR